MDGIATQLLRFATGAAPDRVWHALTTARYLYGMAPVSEWRAGAPVRFTGEGVALSGEVLTAEEPHRLSYSLRAEDGQPETYVTWEILGDGTGSTVLLFVDEPGEPEVEPAWEEVVARLESVLAGTGAEHARRSTA